MPLADYLVGLAFFAATTGGAVAAAVLLVRRRLGHLRGAPRALAVGTLATAGIVAAHLVPGALGVLARGSALAAAAVLLAGALAVPAAPATEPDGPPEPESEAGPIVWIAAAAAVGALALWMVATAWNRTVLPSEGIDTLTFHLPNVARWIQTGSFWQVDQFTPLLANGNYPHTGDVVFLAAVLPWRNDAFTGLVNVPFVVLAGIAVYAIACELRAPRATAVLAAAVLVSLPAVGLPAYGEAMTDAILLAAFGTGVLFLIRHRRNGRRSELVLAGVALGLAFGTKWYGVPAVAIVVAVWAAASLLAGRPWRTVAREGGLLGSLVALAGGFWLVRNLVESGNPLFPQEVSVLGLRIFDAPRDFIRECADFTIADYVGDTGPWREHILPAFGDNYALPGALLAAGFVLAAALSLRRARGRPAPGLPVALFAAAALLAAAYAVTPYSAFGPRGEPILTGANVRYLVPGLLVCAALAGWAMGALGRARGVVALLVLAAVVDGMIRSFTVPLDVVAGVAALLALGATVALAVVVATRRLPPRRALALRVAAAALAGILVVALGHERQRELNDRRYAERDPVFAWLEREAPEGSRIALVGTWSVEGVSPVLPAFGERLRNEVRFVGPTVDGQLREYDRRGDWAAAIRRGGFDLVLAGRAPTGGRRPCPLPGIGSDDVAFAREEGFEPLAASDRLTLWRVR